MTIRIIDPLGGKRPCYSITDVLNFGYKNCL